MRLNTVIKFSDGRVGTICYNFIDGTGGVWGEHEFEMPPSGFDGDLPVPEFMLRGAAIGKRMTERGSFPEGIEWMGERPEFTVIKEGK